MDILETLQQKREVNRMQRHPLSSLSLHERYLYCFGLAVMAKGNMKTIRELAAPFEKVCNTIGISRESSEEMIVDINNHFEQSLDCLVQMLSIERRLSNCFLIDLLKLKEYSDWGKWYCEEVIQQFCYILKLGEETRHFMERFLQERSNGDSDVAHKLVEQYEKNGNSVDYELLRYMNEEYREQRHYSKLILDQGGCVRIESPTQVDSDIVVTKGTKLYISNTTLSVGGSIRIDGGRVEICNSLLEAVGESRQKQYFLTAQEQHTLSIEDTTVDAHCLCPILRQMDGSLQMKNSLLCNVRGDYAVHFLGEKLNLEEVTLKDCSGGGIKIGEDTDVELLHCQFENCRAEHGGAIHCSSREGVHIRECEFHNCRAKFLGAALYFRYKRYGQQVLGCRFLGCVPEQGQVFNAYELKE